MDKKTLLGILTVVGGVAGLVAILVLLPMLFSFISIGDVRP